MVGSEESETQLERPTQDQIIDFILAWKDKPYDYVLKSNQVTAKSLSEKTNMGVDWCKTTLKEMNDAGLCSRERAFARSGGWFYVYSFPDELPEEF